MKLLIQTDLEFNLPFPADAPEAYREEQLQYFRDLRTFAQGYSLWARWDLSGAGVAIRIVAQKVTVDEDAMDLFFSQFLTELFDVEVRYAALGGGNFTLELTKAISRAASFAP